MFLLSPVIAMLYNTVTARFHPILFAEAPFPGGAGPARHKSKGHHTAGFDTKEAAEAHARDDMAPKLPGVRLALEVVFEWDGQGIPAMVQFFPEVEPSRSGGAACG